MSHNAAKSVIVKIGGSLLRDGAPRRLLSELVRHPHLVLVPGGGALADAVRDAQPHMGLTDRAAHAMAILAMEQMAHAVLDIEPALVPGHTLEALAAPRRTAALCFPAQMLIGAAGIAESWEVTSDSLALWIATALGAARLVLVKAPGAAAPRGPLAPSDIPRLARSGLVDGAFEGMARRFKGTIVLANADDSKALEEALHEETQLKDHP